MSAEANTRGCLTAHFLTKIDLDYPCSFATNSTAAKVNAGETIPYVANVTQATLEIRKSRLFVEKYDDRVKKGLIVTPEVAAVPNFKPMKVKYATKEEEANAQKELAILSDPHAAIVNTHFALNALPEVGNTGRPLTLTHFYIESGNLVAPPLSSSTAVGGSSSSTKNGADDLLAVIRMPIHMCSSVGKQGQADKDKALTERQKKRQKRQEQMERAAMGEGSSFGLAGLELIYIPRRGKKESEEEDAGAAGPKPQPKKGGNTNNKKGGKKGGAAEPAAEAPEKKRDVFPAALFDVSVTIAGVQYTYLLSSQFDVLAGRTQIATVAGKQ